MYVVFLAVSVRDELTRRRLEAEEQLKLRLQRAIAEDDLPSACSATDVARYVTTVLQGIPVQAAGGACRENLARTADKAMKHWPPL